MKNLLKIRNFNAFIQNKKKLIHSVRDINLDLFENEIIAIVGESGCGKTTLAQSILRLNNNNTYSGKIIFEDTDLISVELKEMQKIRSRKISIIFQDPEASLNPTMKVGKQISEAIHINERINKREAIKKTLKLMKEVGIPDENIRYNQYPYELSGGLKQRVMIAIAISLNSRILIADEPTTALDVTIQKQILDLFKKLQITRKLSIILITHNLNIVKNLCSRVFIMYAGRIIESGQTKDIFQHPKHPYTSHLLDATFSKEQLKKHFINLENLKYDPALEHIKCPFLNNCIQKKDICKKEFPKNSNNCLCWLNNEDLTCKH